MKRFLSLFENLMKCLWNEDSPVLMCFFNFDVEVTDCTYLKKNDGILSKLNDIYCKFFGIYMDLLWGRWL